MPRMHKYGESKTTRIMMATACHMTSSLGLWKFQAAWFLLNRGYHTASTLRVKNGSTVFQNSGTYLPNYMVCHLPTPQYSHTTIISIQENCFTDTWLCAWGPKNFYTEIVGVLMKIFRNGGFRGIR